MTKRTKINFYCSVISSEDYHENGDYYCFGPVYSHIEPRTVEWVYGGGIAPEALRPLRKLPEDGVEVSMFTDKDLLSPLVDQVGTKYKIALLNECPSIHPFAYEWVKEVEHKFDFIFTYESSLLKRGPKYVSYKPLTAGSALRDKEHKIYDKTQLASIIISEKGKDVIISNLASTSRSLLII